jgi:hypothetical protein
MHKGIRQAIDDLSALSKDADGDDAERIRQIIERLQNFNARMDMRPFVPRRERNIEI